MQLVTGPNTKGAVLSQVPSTISTTVIRNVCHAFKLLELGPNLKDKMDNAITSKRS